MRPKLISALIPRMYSPHWLGNVVRESISDLVNEGDALICLGSDGVRQRKAYLLSHSIEGDCCRSKCNDEIIFKCDH